MFNLSATISTFPDKTIDTDEKVVPRSIPRAYFVILSENKLFV